MEWREKGTCWGKTTSPENDYWYPEEDDPDKANKILIAKTYCNSCPVKKKCLKFSISNEEEYGIWGGMTPRERRARFRRNKNYWNERYETSGDEDNYM